MSFIINESIGNFSHQHPTSYDTAEEAQHRVNELVIHDIMEQDVIPRGFDSLNSITNEELIVLDELYSSYFSIEEVI